MSEVKIAVIKRCPNCNWRVIDKIGVASGIVEIKCPNCHRRVKIDLSLRKVNGIKYRIA